MTMIDVPVAKDDIAEGMETFSLTLNIPSSLSGTVTPGDIVTATAIIIDDTGKIRVGCDYHIIIE